MIESISKRLHGSNNPRPVSARFRPAMLTEERDLQQQSEYAWRRAGAGRQSRTRLSAAGGSREPGLAPPAAVPRRSRAARTLVYSRRA
ncbi:hypothetical protein EVAR_60550_1 [Eumeta japonica]|uniref:Uncharacterized protein n=1 Tax=Eumeta variegata TaxID=151549 RepID=A0A4C1YDE1_EUMVA|nr:hypothetical protein EVAR_60550_1 [Eumeta japonica]